MWISAVLFSEMPDKYNFYFTAGQGQHLFTSVYTTGKDIFNLTDLYMIAKTLDRNNVLIFAEMMHGWQ
jgi:hypothetical protein